MKQRKHQSQPVACSILMVLWAAVLIVAFLLYRGSDAGQLPALITSFLHTATEDRLFSATGFAASAAGTLVAGLIVLSWYGLGDLVLRLAPIARDTVSGTIETPASLDRARKTAFGAGVWSLLWFALGMAQMYRRAVAIIALAAGLGLYALALVHNRKAQRRLENDSVWVRIISFLILFVLALAFIAALAPPTAKDTLLYHLSLPKAYMAAGGIVDVPYNIAGFLPLGAEMHNVWALLVSGPGNLRTGEVAAGAVMFSFFPLLLAAVYGWARERGAGRVWALMAALLTASVPTAYHVAASGYVDLALSLYVALAVQAMGRWWTTLGRRNLLHLALALGFALCIKPTALFLGLIFGVLVLLRIRKAQKDQNGETTVAPAGRIALSGACALVLAATLASPWYIRTWAKSGSPLFPFYIGLWKGSAPGWDLERYYLFQALNDRYGGAPKSAIDYLVTPVRLSVMAQPEQPVYYDGVLGVAFLLGVPLVIWACWQSRLDVELKLTSAVSAALFLFWLFTSQQLRYLLPALPGLAVAIAVSGNLLSRQMHCSASRALQVALVCGAVAGILVSVAWFTEQNPLRVVAGGEPRDDYLARRLDYYSYYKIINSQLPATARVWLINMRRDTYYLERPYFSDYIFEDYTLRKYVEEAKDAAELRARVWRDGITHLLVRHDWLLDYDRSAIVDDRRPKAENLARMNLLNDFLKNGTRIIRNDQKFMLIELPETETRKQ
jgi:hypothetical protein